jgi:hypothetical protein
MVESERQANQQVGHAVAEVAADQGVGFDSAPRKVETAEIGQSAVSRGEEAAADGPPPPEAPVWPWTDQTCGARIAEARSLLTQRQPQKVVST